MTTAVIVPAYFSSDSFRLNFFRNCLESITKQKDTVGIIVDDGSSFDVENFIKETGSSILRYIRRERSESDLKTSSNAMNLGLELCLSKSRNVFTRSERDTLNSVAYLHSDDRLTLNSVSKRLEKLSSDVPVVYSDMEIFKNHDGELEKHSLKIVEDLTKFKDFHSFPHHTLMWELNFLDSLRNYCNENFEIDGIFDSRLGAAEDRDVTISTFSFLKEIGKTPDYANFVSYLYTIQSDSITNRLSRVERKMYYKLLAQKHLGINNICGSSPLFNDLPWSLGTYLLESIKDSLRPVRDFMRKVK